MRTQFLRFCRLLALGLLGSGAAYAQALDEEFNGTDINQLQGWSGSSSEFDLSGGYLNLHAQQPTYGFMQTALLIQDTAVWETSILCGLSPSSANKGGIVLSSSRLDLTQPHNRWELMVGASGTTDGLELWYRTQTTARHVATFGSGFGSPFLASVRISRSPTGVWRCWAGFNNQALQYLGQAQDATPLAGIYTGIQVQYTVSGQNFLWHWDYLRVYPASIPDSPERLARVACAGRRLYVEAPRGVHPGPAAQVVADGNLLALLFEKQMDGRYMALSPDALPGVLGADSALRFGLQVQGWIDSLSRPVPAANFPCRCLPEAQRTQLTELKAGAGGQPFTPEFIELQNPSDHAVWLEGVSLEDASGSIKILPADSLAAGAYRAYTAASGLPALQALDPTAQAASLPSLNDDGDNLRLRIGSSGQDSLTYDGSFWVKTADVSVFSLERGPTCLPNNGWYPSRAAAGATPGRGPDYDWPTDTNLAPRLVAAEYRPGTGLILYLKPAGDSLKTALAQLGIDPPLPGGPLTWANGLLTYPLAGAPDSTLNYRLTLSGLPGCGGSSVASTLNFNQPVDADSGRLVLNELLFDPLSGGLPFVELYNPGPRWVRLSGLGIASLRDPWADTAWLPTTIAPLEPGGYRWLARESRAVMHAYPKAVAGNFIPFKLPTLDANGGTLLLLKPDGNPVDALAYSPDLHTSTLSKTEGVSLERVSANLATQSPGNWQSCAAHPPATPGYANSQMLVDPTVSGDGLQAEPSAFSPNADGYQDVTAFSAKGLPPGTSARLTLFDPAGRLVRRLSPQTLAGPALLAIWDGKQDDGTAAGAGLYVALAEFYHPSITIAPRKTVVGIQP